MYQFSDSDSVDSDEGIRYKTDSIRNKKSKTGSIKKAGNRDHKDRRRSRSPCKVSHREIKKVKKHGREHSPKEISGYKKTYKEKSRQHERCDKPNITNKVKYRQSFEIDGKNKSGNETFGPALPPKIIKMDLQRERLEENNEALNELPVEPTLPPDFKIESTLEEESDEDSSLKPSKNNFFEPKQIIGPTLPPHSLIINSSSDGASSYKTIGPTLPAHLKEKIEHHSAKIAEEDETYGPIPEGQIYSRAHVELEERAMKIKIDQLGLAEDKHPTREEWMLTLPEAKATNFGLGPRQFRAKAGPDMSDRSSWTDTPEDKARKKMNVSEKKVDLKKQAELRDIQKRDKKQEAMANRNKKNTESLLEIHRKKLKQEKKNDSGPSERRPFSREIDLQVNRFDEAQKLAVLKKAQQLDSRFSSGESKFL